MHVLGELQGMMEAEAEGMLRLIGKYRKLGRGKGRSSPRVLKGNAAVLTPWFQTSSLQTVRQ